MDYLNDTNYTIRDCYHPHNYSSPVRSLYFQGTVYITYSIIFIVSLIGNGIVCYIVTSSPRMRTVTNYFIMNLAIGDILITIFGVPFTSVSYLQQYWPFGAVLCPVVNYSQAISVFVSAYTMLAISVDRYMAIMWPLKPRISKRLSAIIIFIIWLIAGLTALPICVMSTLYQPAEYTWYEACDRYLCTEDWQSIGYEYKAFYTKAIMVLQYVIPLSVLIFTYTNIAIVVWCHRIPGEAENCRDQRLASSKRKMVKMMVTVVFVYTLCWLPFNIFWLMEESISENLITYLWFTFYGLAMSHACYNPIIYFFMNVRFRTGFVQVLRSIPCFKKCLPKITMRRSRSSTGFPLTSTEGTESTLLHRNNTSTTYISMRRKTGSRITSSNNQLPVRSASMMRNAGNHVVKRVRYPSDIMENEI